MAMVDNEGEDIALEWEEAGTKQFSLVVETHDHRSNKIYTSECTMI